MNFFYSVVLGIVEGFTEFLPISSTGHLILTTKLLNLTQTNFLKSFEIFIQLGAILSIVFLYWRKYFLDKKIIKKVITAFIPTAIGGVVLYKIFREFLLNDNNIVLWALFLGGIFLILFELFYKGREGDIEDISKMSYLQCFFIGVFQIVAIIPGISRAAATIIGGLLLKLKRKAIIEFSFLLAVPTMAAATIFDLFKSAREFSFGQFNFLITGFITSFVVAILSVKFLLYFIKKHNFTVFGIYRIILALLFLLLIF